MTIYSEDSDGNIMVILDSRWQYPELLGYKPEDPQYKLLQKLWEEATGRPAIQEATADELRDALQAAD